MKLAPCGHPLPPTARKDAKYCSRKCQKNSVRHNEYLDYKLEFIGLDGEGITTPLGEHKYVLFGVGSKQIESPPGLALHWEEIFGLLWESFLQKPDAVYAGFFLGYDFAQWFKTFPYDKAYLLFSRTGKAIRLARARKSKPDTHYPVSVRVCGEKGTWYFDGIGERVLRVSKDTGAHKRWLYINDAGPFFQSSLLNVIDPKKWDKPICTPEEYESIKKGKSERGKSVLNDHDRYYNRLENDILSRLLGRYNEGLVSQDIRLRRSDWYGPGRAANEWLKSRDKANGECSIRKEAVANALGDLWEICKASYIGGWFEICVHGHIRGTSFEYDINSAYPSIMAGLPCLIHGQWTHGYSYPKRKTSKYTLVRAKVYGSNPYLGSMLHRGAKGDRICRPHNTSGIYWLEEIHASQRAGLLDTCEIEEWWEYEPAKECHLPLSGIHSLYEHRLAIGKDTAEGKACKLIYNSGYGKCAQSVGNPAFASPFYASYITAGCRIKILDAIASHPYGAHDVLMVATDAVFFLRRHPGLPLSDKLGEWSAETKKNLTIFKPGHYWDDGAREAIRDGKMARFKARGVNAKAFSKVLGDVDDRFRDWDAKYRSLVSYQGGNRWVELPRGVTKKWIEHGEVRRHTPDHGWWNWPSVRYPVDFSMVTISQALQWNDWGKCGQVNVGMVVGPIQSDPWMKRDTSDDGTGNTYEGNYKLYRSRPYPFAFRRTHQTTKEKQLGFGYSTYELSNTPYAETFGLQRETEEILDNSVTPDGPLDLLTLDALGLGKLRSAGDG